MQKLLSLLLVFVGYCIVFGKSVAGCTRRHSLAFVAAVTVALVTVQHASAQVTDIDGALSAAQGYSTTWQTWALPLMLFFVGLSWLMFFRPKKK